MPDHSAFELDVIAYDPFAGDFGGSDDRDFSDKMARAAKDHPDCQNCGEVILKGERHRHKVAKFDGEMMSWRWCWQCCVAMAAVWLPWDGKSDLHQTEIERRNSIRIPECPT